MAQRTTYVTIRTDDLAGLFLAALILSTLPRISKENRVNFLALHNRVVKQTGLQLPPGREAVKCA